MTEICLYQVDAFTDRRFAGNPAAVCLLDSAVASLDDQTRQNIATEMNLSETAFVEVLHVNSDSSQPSFQGAQPVASFVLGQVQCVCDREFLLRWFTPVQEVPLCGHATLASAAALIAEGNTANPIKFKTLHSGWLTVSRIQHNGTEQLQMSLPLYAPHDKLPSGTEPGSPLIMALLGEHADWLLDIKFVSDLKYLLVALKAGVSRRQLESLRPNFLKLHAAVPQGTLVGVIVTSYDDSDDANFDVYSRFFAPWVGPHEDPVTGSAHAILGPYWAQLKGKDTLKACQCSSRVGMILVEVDWKENRVAVTGSAVVITQGRLFL